MYRVHRGAALVFGRRELSVDIRRPGTALLRAPEACVRITRGVFCLLEEERVVCHSSWQRHAPRHARRRRMRAWRACRVAPAAFAPTGVPRGGGARGGGDGDRCRLPAGLPSGSRHTSTGGGRPAGRAGGRRGACDVDGGGRHCRSTASWMSASILLTLSVIASAALPSTATRRSRRSRGTTKACATHSAA